MEYKILVADDDKEIREAIEIYLTNEQMKVLTACDGQEALKVLEANPDIHLIIMDLMMPKMDGYEVCRKIREKSNVPIIMLTARADEVDKVVGLEMGADDYVTKPFGNRELIARVKANLRRSDIAPVTNNEKDGNNQVYGDLNIDFDRYEVTKRGEVINLTLREFELLTFLATQTPTIFTRENLLEKVWGYEYFGDVRAVDVTIRRLREKIEDDPSKPKYIVTKRGVGYYFNC